MAALPASPLVGRDAEVTAVVAAADAARAGEGRCVVVAGEAGLGKTRVVTESLARITAVDEPTLVLVGHAADMTTGAIPFGVVADTMRDLLRQRGLSVLTDHEHVALAPLLPGEASGTADAARLVSAALDLFARLSSDELLVWVVEDLHWADSATRDLVNLVVRTLRGRLLVLVTVRTDDPDRSSDVEAALTAYMAGLARLSATVRLDLQRLTEAEVHRQLDSLVPDLPWQHRRRIARLSDGVPFVVEELAAVPDRPDLASAGAALWGRVQCLGTEPRRLVDAASVGDGHLRISLLEQVVDATSEELDAALAEAVSAGVLVMDPTVDSVGFRHALLRDTADRSLGPGARRAWHRRWAEVLEASPGVLAADPARLTIAEHWHQARDVTRSLDAAYAAVPAAGRLGEPRGQAVLWVRIFENWDARDPSSPVGLLSLREAIGQALSRPSNLMPDAVFNRFWACVRGLPLDPATRSVADMVDWLVHSPKGQSDHPGLLAALLEHDWLHQPPDDLTQTALGLAYAASATSHAEDDEAYLRRALEIAEAQGDADRLASLAIIRGFSHQFRRGVRAAVETMEQDRHLLDNADPGQQISFAGNLAWALICLGEHDRADEVLSEQLERQVHLEARPSSFEHLVENAAFTWLCTGQWARCRALMERVAAWWSDDVRLSNLHLARLDLRQHGRTDEAHWLPHLGRSIVTGPTDADVRGLLALAAGLRGDLERMRVLTRPLWSERDPGVLESLWFTLLNLARVEADNRRWGPEPGQDREAERHLALIEEIATHCPDEGRLDAAWRLDLAAQRARFAGVDARQPLTAALQAWEIVGHVPDAAEVRLELADECARLGDRDAAREHLAAAREVAHDLDAELLLAMAAAVTDRHGLTERQRRREDVLTAREAEVLDQLVAGRTNAEIAETLFMSPKTASVHVSHIFTKLGAANRTEAAAIARRQGLVPSEDGAG